MQVLTQFMNFIATYTDVTHPLGLDQSRGDQIDNAKNFESKGYGRHIPEDQLQKLTYCKN